MFPFDKSHRWELPACGLAKKCLLISNERVFLGSLLERINSKRQVVWYFRAVNKSDALAAVTALSAQVGALIATVKSLAAVVAKIKAKVKA